MLWLNRSMTPTHRKFWVAIDLQGPSLMAHPGSASSAEPPASTSEAVLLGQPGPGGATMGPNFLGRAPPWVRDKEWQARSQRLYSLPITTPILELCAGAGTASLALRLLLGPDKVRFAGAWDTDVELLCIHEAIHGAGAAAGKVHLGKQQGDILTTDLATFPDANILVAGPPCPPFSSCGKRLALEDSRARPFERCVEIIVDLDRRASDPVPGQPGVRDELMLFMLENVLGISFTPADKTRTPLDILLGELRSKLGPAWIVQAIHANALHFGLPQNRPRIYIVGRRAKFYTQYMPAAPRPFQRQVRPAELLDTSDTQRSTLTTLQKQRLSEWKKVYQSALDNPECSGKYAFVEAGRDPTGRTSWSSRSSAKPPPVDRCQCLRASGPQINVFALGQGTQDLTLDRCLRVRERAALQGFPDRIGRLPLTEKVGRRVFGNAMSVPVVGTLLAVELDAIQATLHAAAARAEAAQAPVVSPLRSEASRAEADKRGPGPTTRHWMAEGEASVDDNEDVMPGQLSATIRWAANIMAHWESGQPGRAPRPEVTFQPGDHHALAKRQCTEWSRGNLPRGQPGFPGPSCVESRDLPDAEDPILGSFEDSLNDSTGQSQAARRTVGSVGPSLPPDAASAEVHSGQVAPCPRTLTGEPEAAGDSDTDEVMGSFD